MLGSRSLTFNDSYPTRSFMQRKRNKLCIVDVESTKYRNANSAIVAHGPCHRVSINSAVWCINRDIKMWIFTLCFILDHTYKHPQCIRNGQLPQYCDILSVQSVAYPEGGTWVNVPPVKDWKKFLAPELQTDGCFATGVTRQTFLKPNENVQFQR